MAEMFLSDRDLRAMLNITRQYDPVGPEDVLPPELQQELLDLVPCDILSLSGQDSVLRSEFSNQCYGDMDDHVAPEDDLFWHHYYDCLPCTYPERTNDVASVTKTSDFYGMGQWHGQGMYVDRAAGGYRFEHVMMLCLPEGLAPTRLMRVLFFRETGSDFTERDRAVLTLLRPHLVTAYASAKQSRSGLLPLTSRQWEVLRYVAAGHSNYQIARRLHVAEGTIRKHLENTFARLPVTNRAAAIALVGPELSARTLTPAPGVPALQPR